MQLVVDHDVDSCIHFAAYKAVGESMEQPGRYFANNVTGTERLVDALNRRGVEQVVFSSSCSVYGTPAEVPVRETAPLHPESVYAESKRMVERHPALVRAPRRGSARSACATSTRPARRPTRRSARTGAARRTSSR